MRKKDVVSVIVPVHNVEKYLERCVESIVGQTYDNLQIILVDDGSTDKSGAICDRLAGGDKRIAVFHKNWGGLADTRNVGLAFATGDFISFVDSDDYIQNTMLEEMVSVMKKQNSDIVVCGRFDVYEGNSLIRKSYCLDHEEVYESTGIMKEYFKNRHLEASSCCDKMFRHSLIQRLHFPRGKVSEDVYFTYGAFKKAGRVVHMGKPMYYYCHRRNSLSTKIPMDKTELELMDFLKEIEKSLWITGDYAVLKEFYAFYVSTVNVLCEAAKKSAKVDRSFRKYVVRLKLRTVMRLPAILHNSCITADKKKRLLKALLT